MTTTERDKTCEERIDGELADRIATLEELHQAIEDSRDTDTEDDAYEALSEFPLSIDVQHKMVVQICWGGPSDQFEVEIVKGAHGWELANDHATYRFLDWFDGATRTTDDPTVMGWLENLVEIAAIGDDVGY